MLCFSSPPPPCWSHPEKWALPFLLECPKINDDWHGNKTDFFDFVLHKLTLKRPEWKIRFFILFLLFVHENIRYTNSQKETLNGSPLASLSLLLFSVQKYLLAGVRGFRPREN